MNYHDWSGNGIDFHDDTASREPEKNESERFDNGESNMEIQRKELIV